MYVFIFCLILTENEGEYELVECKKPGEIDVPDYDDTGPPDEDGVEINIPALVVNDDFTMVEGAAICMYLADTYGRFLPDQEHKAQYYRYINRISTLKYTINANE